MLRFDLPRWSSSARPLKALTREETEDHRGNRQLINLTPDHAVHKRYSFLRVSSFPKGHPSLRLSSCSVNPITSLSRFVGVLCGVSCLFPFCDGGTTRGSALGAGSQLRSRYKSASFGVSRSGAGGSGDVWAECDRPGTDSAIACVGVTFTYHPAAHPRA